MRNKDQATTLKEEFVNAECKQCDHHWQVSEDKARCTHPDMDHYARPNESFIPCNNYKHLTDK